MTILKEQLRRTIELMGILSEQDGDGKAVNVKPEEFVCDRCRWNGLKTHKITSSGKKTGEILLFLTLFNHTGNDTDRIERFDWRGDVKDERRGYSELKRQADAANKKYSINAKIPELNGFMEKEEEEEGPRPVGESTPFIAKLKK